MLPVYDVNMYSNKIKEIEFEFELMAAWAPLLTTNMEYL